MPGNYKKLQSQITFDALMEIVHSEFSEIPDQRRANARYELTDFLSGAFAMFSLKSPSLLAFEQRSKAEDHNLESIYHINAIPSDTQMRTALDPIDPAPPAGIVRYALCHLARRGRGQGVLLLARLGVGRGRWRRAFFVQANSLRALLDAQLAR